MSRVRALSCLALAVVLSACGESSNSPSTPSTPTAATPTPAPTATPTPSVAAYGCPLPVMPNLGTECPKERPTLDSYVTNAIDKTIREHPEYFEFEPTGGVRVRDRARYIGTVVTNVRAQGVCAIEEKEEIALKTTNQFNEQYNIWTSSGYIRRPPGAYITTCYPAQF